MTLPRNPNAFANSPLDRAGHRRRDIAWLTEARASADARFIPFADARPFVVGGAKAAEAGWLTAHAVSAFAPNAETLFLGVDPHGAPHFAIDVRESERLAELGRFEDLRALGPRLGADDVAMLGCAKAIFEWHARNGFCAKCGTPTQIVEAGWKRECPTCKSEHFPRVDPVVIMLPAFGDRCLLGRQHPWPRGMHSALAGYMEPGETIEEAVARETLEEAGLIVTQVRLHSTQPWPFPSSLMIGVLCDVENDRETIDTDELESGRWFTRDEARQMLRGEHADCFAPPPFAIAHMLLKAWAE